MLESFIGTLFALLAFAMLPRTWRLLFGRDRDNESEGTQARFTTIRIAYLTKELVNVTLTPTRIGRLLGVKQRNGYAVPLESEEGGVIWCWVLTDRYVGPRIEQQIEVCPDPGFPIHQTGDLRGRGPSSEASPTA